MYFYALNETKKHTIRRIHEADYIKKSIGAGLNTVKSLSQIKGEKYRFKYVVCWFLIK